MIQTFKAVINEKGKIRILDSIKFNKAKRALLIVLDDDSVEYLNDNALPYKLSESSLSKDWNRPEEDEAWAYLQ